MGKCDGGHTGDGGATREGLNPNSYRNNVAIALFSDYGAPGAGADVAAEET